MLLKLKCAEAMERARLNCKLKSDMKQGRFTCVWMARAIHNVESRIQGLRSKARMYIRVTLSMTWCILIRCLHVREVRYYYFNHTMIVPDKKLKKMKKSRSAVDNERTRTVC